MIENYMFTPFTMHLGKRRGNRRGLKCQMKYVITVTQHSVVLVWVPSQEELQTRNTSTLFDRRAREHSSRRVGMWDKEEKANSKGCVLKGVTPMSNWSLTPQGRKIWVPAKNTHLKVLPPRVRKPWHLDANSHQSLVEGCKGIHMGVNSPGNSGLLDICAGCKHSQQVRCSGNWMLSTYNDMLRLGRMWWVLAATAATRKRQMRHSGKSTSCNSKITLRPRSITLLGMLWGADAHFTKHKA